MSDSDSDDLKKLKLVPVKTGYSYEPGEEVLSEKLDGGASRYRQDIAGAYAKVEAEFDIHKSEYRYLSAFHSLYKADPFLIDIMLGKPDVEEHEAHFVPGSFSLDSVRNCRVTVSLELEVKPHKPDDDEFFEEEIFELIEDLMDLQIADSPEDLAEYTEWLTTVKAPHELSDYVNGI